MRLPYLSIGVQGKGGAKLLGGVWLNVSKIEPGKKRVVQHDCYKDDLSPDQLELFACQEPIPEKKAAYWEFKKMPAAKKV